MPSKYLIPKISVRETGGTLSDPEIHTEVHIVYTDSRNAGPYQQCKECRATHTEWLEAGPIAKEGEKPEKIKKRYEKYCEQNPEPKVNFTIVGSGRCLEHISSYHEQRLKDGKITQKEFREILADAEQRDNINIAERTHKTAPVDS